MNETSNATASEPSKGNSTVRVLAIIARILLGLTFLVFGLNGFFHFIPQPKEMPEDVMAFMGGMMKTHYMFPLLFGTQALVGALLLVNRFVPLALVLIAPVVVNIILFHLFVQPMGLPIAIIVVVFELFLAWTYRKHYCSVLAMRATPE